MFRDVPANAGVLDPITFVIPPTTLLNVGAPRPVGGYTETILRMIDVVFQAFAQIAPERSNGCAYGTINALSLAGHRRDGRRCTSARARGRVIERIRIEGVSRLNRTHGFKWRERELCHVRFEQHDRPGLPDLPHHESVAGGNELGQRLRTGRRPQSLRFVVVLDDDGDALQRTHGRARFHTRIEFIRGLQGVGIQQHH